jgi:DNA-binding LacI/PurR family transcriptional regulator
MAGQGWTQVTVIMEWRNQRNSVTVTEVTSPTLSQIAATAGVSKMTVSRALRGQRHVSAETRDRVLAAAGGLGWRPDPEISRLMSRLRGGRESRDPPSLAFVWSERVETPLSPWSRRLSSGAAERARQLGYRLEEFQLGAGGVTGQRLSEILEARGINGLVLSPLVSRCRGRVSLRWDSFSSVVIGLGYAQPALHRVHHHHFHGMMTVLHALRAQGFRRVGFYCENTVNERMFRAWSASFLAHHPLPMRQAAELLRIARKPGRADFLAWLERIRPEAVVDSGIRCFEWLESLPRDGRPAHATLSWSENRRGLSGLDQQPEVLGLAAIDLLAEQIASNERGVPRHPKIVLTAGQWRPAGV